MLVLFDLDDTLLDHTTAMRSAATALWSSIKSCISKDQFLALWTRSHERHYPRYLCGELTHQGQRRARVRDAIDPTLDDPTADALFELYFSRYRDAWLLFSDAKMCLQYLQGHRLGIISNGPSDEQRMKLVRTGIAEKFACILISEECGVAKPANEIFLQACEAMGEHPSNALYVGDRYDLDAEPSRRAGLCGVWLDRHGRQTLEHLPPVINGLQELPALVDSIAQRSR
jgi:putative hydrolase of the HAD superfamily